MAPERKLVQLPCPECRQRGVGGGARIGHRRNKCATCNNFAQNVMRMTRKKLIEKYRAEYERIRYRVELDLYPQVLDDFEEANLRHAVLDEAQLAGVPDPDMPIPERVTIRDVTVTPHAEKTRQS